MKKLLSHYITAACVIAATLFTSCQTDEVVLSDQDAFVKIYDYPLQSGNISPVGISEAGDSSYVIVGRNTPLNSTFFGTSLLVTDAKGQKKWEQVLDTKYVNPLEGIHSDVSGSYFFCMDASTMGTYFMHFNPQNETLEEVAYFPELTYPLSSYHLPGGGALIQYYDRDARSGGLAKIASNATIEWMQSYPVLEDVEDKIIAHLTGTGRRYPFFCKQTNSGNFMMNGFYNFSLSLLFISAQDRSIQGIVSGYRYESGISQAQHINGNQYAIATFDPFGAKVDPFVSVADKEINSMNALNLPVFSELSPLEQVFFLPYSGDLGNHTLVLGTTKSKQLALYAFETESGFLKASLIKGEVNPYQATGLIQTSDQGLALLFSTHVAGRYERIGMMKLSKTEIDEWLSNGELTTE